MSTVVSADSTEHTSTFNFVNLLEKHCFYSSSQAITLSHTCSPDELGSVIAEIARTTGLDITSTGQVACARDTRYVVFWRRLVAGGVILGHPISPSSICIRIVSSCSQFFVNTIAKPSIDIALFSQFFFCRPSGKRLLKHLLKGVELTGVDGRDYGKSNTLAS